MMKLSMATRALKSYSPSGTAPIPDAPLTRLMVPLPLLKWKTTKRPGSVAVPKMMYSPMTTALKNEFSPEMPEALPMRVRVPPLSWKTTAIPG